METVTEEAQKLSETNNYMWEFFSFCEKIHDIIGCKEKKMGTENV